MLLEIRRGNKMADKVKCSQGHENQVGDNFCRFCGEPISGGQIKCPSCGAQNDSGANFCGKCGKPLRSEVALPT